MALQLAVAWFAVFGACYFVADILQPFFYDRSVDGLWWRALVAAVPLALLLLRFPQQLDTMFTEAMLLTAGIAVVWFLVYWLILSFNPAHAAIVAIPVFLMLSPTFSSLLSRVTGAPAYGILGTP